MPLFNLKIDVDVNRITEVVSEHWGIQLGSVIKASQNHTYNASNSAGIKFVVRVSLAEDSSLHRVDDEITFVNFLVEHKLNHICAPVAKTSRSNEANSRSDDFILNDRGLTVVVFEWAIGEPIDFMAYKHLTDRNLIFAWGATLAHMHRVSRLFTVAHPERSRRMQRWDQIHQGIMKGSVIHPDDEAVVSDPQHFGVIHGDLNCSNFFYCEKTRVLSVFDWDQTQQGWYLWDVAQACVSVHMLAEGGSLVDGSPVPEAQPERFITWLLEGYESVSCSNRDSNGVGEESVFTAANSVTSCKPGSVDRTRLMRMIALRKSFYERFCRQAIEEGDVPADMMHFIEYVVRWFDRLK